ncbi:MAG: hypothetical protein IPK31_10760 [Chitinophagaceae bacterium]|nr:hypothetical protein [Chitinophagaceae bacterium]
MKKLNFSLLLVLLTACFSCNENNTAEKTAENDDAKTAYLLNDTASITLPEISAYLEKVKTTLQQPVPVLLFQDSADQMMKDAETICLSNADFIKYLRDSISKNAFRNEIFNIYKARESDFNKTTRGFCTDGSCYKVELYNFALNLTTVGLVNVNSKQVLQVTHVPNTQPEIPQHLKTIAIHIAAANTEVQKVLGFKPGEKDAVMSATKTSLNRSRCERSLHLCVAPTFVKGVKALWTIVDLTELKVAGLRWTNVGSAGPESSVTLRKIENETITECFCKNELNLERNGWKMNYMITSSDGLRISNVQYKSKPIVSSAKLVDWHVSYSDTEGFGYSDAIGCPYFSTAAVIAVEPPEISDLIEDGKKIGFVLVQNFSSERWPQPCNYKYQQRYEFFDDGSFRVAVANIGRGCGNDGTYRPVIRIAFAGGSQTFDEWNGTGWNSWATEKWQLQQANTSYTKEGYLFKISGQNGLNYYVEPGRGQFKDGGRGDRAYTYITINKPGTDEGETDLVTIGPCCNADYRQGPEKFIEPTPESLSGRSLVMWYVPVVRNDDTKGNEYCWADSYVKNGVYSTISYPCFSGPMFIPVK